MRVQTIRLDEDENPDLVIVEMTADEAAFLTRLMGQMSPRIVADALGDVRWFEASSEIYRALAGSVFNRFYDEGVDAVIPDWKKAL